MEHAYQESPTMELRDYLAVARARRAVIATVAGAVVLLAAAFSFTRTPVYVAEARVQAHPIPQSAPDPAGGAINMQTEREVASSAHVAQISARELGGSEDPEDLLERLTVDLEPETEILVFSFSAPTAREAQRGARAFSEAYLENRRDQVEQNLRALSAPVEASRDELQAELSDLQARLLAAEDPLRQATLEARVNSLVSRIALLEQRLEEIRQAGEVSVGQVITPAAAPRSPASPNHPLNLVVGVLLGLSLGVGTAFVMERLDDRLRGREDLESHAGTPVVAIIPSARKTALSQGAPGGNAPVIQSDPHSPAAEGYRTLRTSVLFDAASHMTKVVLITSPDAGEGKTTTTANLGLALAQAGKRVALVTGDLRRPKLQEYFGVRNRIGLTNVIAGEMVLNKALNRPRGLTNLRLLTSGPLPGNPAELLASPAMAQIVKSLAETSDIVLIDGAPLLAVADSLTLAQLADAVLLVADASITRRSLVGLSAQLLARVNARTMGAVLNNYDPSKTRSYHTYPTYESHVAPVEVLQDERMRKQV